MKRLMIHETNQTSEQRGEASLTKGTANEPEKQELLAPPHNLRVPVSHGQRRR